MHFSFFGRLSKITLYRRKRANCTSTKSSTVYWKCVKLLTRSFLISGTSHTGLKPAGWPKILGCIHGGSTSAAQLQPGGQKKSGVPLLDACLNQVLKMFHWAIINNIFACAQWKNLIHSEVWSTSSCTAASWEWAEAVLPGGMCLSLFSVLAKSLLERQIVSSLLRQDTRALSSSLRNLGLR